MGVSRGLDVEVIKMLLCGCSIALLVRKKSTRVSLVDCLEVDLKLIVPPHFYYSVPIYYHPPHINASNITRTQFLEAIHEVSGKGSDMDVDVDCLPIPTIPDNCE
jgi:hypothetical protein